MSFFQDMAHNPFLLPGLAAGLLAGLACGLIGPYVMTRRIVFLGGAIAHIAVGGLGAAIYLRHLYPETFAWLQPIHGAAVVSVLAALLLARLEPTVGGKQAARPVVPMDTVIGALWAIGMAVGILLVKQTPGYSSDLMSYLFGNLAYVDWADVYLMLALVAVVLVTVSLYQKRFLALCLDPEQMQLQGVRAKSTSAVLLVLVALTVIVLTQVVGLILVVALLSLPAATAGLIARRLPSMILLSAAIASVLTTVPRIAVYGTHVSPEPAVVLAAGLVFLLAYGERSRRATKIRK
ncbi:MAG: metal ABC transporter permease [bacterium]|nr:metal ABC transporter permease [bacterium]